MRTCLYKIRHLHLTKVLPLQSCFSSHSFSVFNIKVPEDKGTTAEGQPQSKAESLCSCTKPAFCTCPGWTCSQGFPIPRAALCGSCSRAQAAPWVVSQRFPISRDGTPGSDAFGSPKQVLDMQVGLIHIYSVSSEEAMMVFEIKSWGYQAQQYLAKSTGGKGTGNSEGSKLCSMALPPFWAGAWRSQHRQVRRSTNCCKHPFRIVPFHSGLFLCYIWVKSYCTPQPTDLFMACQTRRKAAAVSGVQEQWLKILNAAFEMASPKARESPSFAFVGGPNSATDPAKWQLSEPLHKSNATETLSQTRVSERQPQALLEREQTQKLQIKIFLSRQSIFNTMKKRANQTKAPNKLPIKETPWRDPRSISDLKDWPNQSSLLSPFP